MIPVSRHEARQEIIRATFMEFLPGIVCCLSFVGYAGPKIAFLRIARIGNSTANIASKIMFFGPRATNDFFKPYK